MESRRSISGVEQRKKGRKGSLQASSPAIGPYFVVDPSTAGFSPRYHHAQSSITRRGYQDSGDDGRFREDVGVTGL